MDAQTIILQQAVGAALIGAMPASWQQIVASYEIEDEGEERTQDLIVVYVFREGHDFQSASLESPPLTIAQSFLALNQHMGESAKERWSSAEVKVERDGAYEFSFSFNQPKRINGIYDNGSYRKFSRYADIYKAERRAAPQSRPRSVADVNAIFVRQHDMDTGTAELLDPLTGAIIKAIPDSWERAIAGYEVEDRDGRVENIIVVYVRRDGDDFSTAGLEHTPGSIEAAFFALHEASSPSRSERWSTAEIVINPEGTYKISFSFDPPKRINGIFDHDSYKKFKIYAETCETDKAAGAAP